MGIVYNTARATMLIWGLLLASSAIADEDAISALQTSEATELNIESEADLDSKTIIKETEATAYTLQDAVFSARERNAQLRAGQEATLAAHTDKHKAFMELAPNVRLDHNLVRNKPSSSFIKSNPSYNDPHVRNTNIVVTQSLFSGGSTIHNIRRTDHLAQAADANFTDLQHSVILGAINAYESLRTARNIHEMNVKNEQTLAHYLELTQTRFKYGAVTHTDVMQVEARLANAMAGKIRAWNNVIIAEAQFEHIVGHYPPLELTPAVVDKVPVPANFEAMLAVAIERSPELLAARQSFGAAARGVDGAIAHMLPSVTAQAQRSNSDTSKTSINKRDGETFVLSVSVPIFQSGMEYADIKKSRHIREQSRYSMEETRRKVKEDTRRAWENYNTAQAVLDATSKAVSAAEQAYEGVVEEAKAGARTSLNVLDAELELFSARIQHRQAHADTIVAVYVLHKVMGDLSDVI